MDNYEIYSDEIDQIYSNEIKLDPKYTIRVWWTDRVPMFRIAILDQAGVPISFEEPLILFRASDRNALEALRAYRTACNADRCNDYHLMGIDNRIEAFERFTQEHAANGEIIVNIQQLEGI
jgi:hypothetical protein